MKRRAAARAPEGRRADQSQVARAVRAAALANLAYFGVEFAVAISIGSVSLFADSIDFLEDAAVNGLILFGLSWTARRERDSAWRSTHSPATRGCHSLHRLGAWRAGHAPAPVPLSITGLGALAVNFACAWTLAKARHAHGSLTKAAFLSARNDVIADVALLHCGRI